MLEYVESREWSEKREKERETAMRTRASRLASLVFVLSRMSQRRRKKTSIITALHPSSYLRWYKCNRSARYQQSIDDRERKRFSTWPRQTSIKTRAFPKATFTSLAPLSTAIVHRVIVPNASFSPPSANQPFSRRCRRPVDRICSNLFSADRTIDRSANSSR